MKTYEEMASLALERGNALRKRALIARKMTLRCIVVVLCALCVGMAVVAVVETDIYYQAGQFLKDVLQNKNQDPTVLAVYNGTPITQAAVDYNMKMNIFRSDEAVQERDTPLEVVNKIIESMMMLEEAERRGLQATEEEIADMLENARQTYSFPEGKEMIDSYLQGAGITFEEYMAMLEEQAPRVISRQKMLDAIGREYCEANGLEFTKVNAPKEMREYQQAFIRELFEKNKHKIIYYIDN